MNVARSVPDEPSREFRRFGTHCETHCNALMKHSSWTDANGSGPSCDFRGGTGLAKGAHMSIRAVSVFAVACLALVSVPAIAHAGPETSLRELASSQIKKGVRSIGMGGDGATLGNYALVHRDAGTAILDYGLVHFSDTGNDFTFTAVGFTTPTFWDDAALYVIAMSQHATNVRVWSATAPTPSKPPSTGDGSNQAVFVKLAKPLGKGFSAGVLLSYELSQMTLLPDGGAPSIDYRTAWRPSGGAGLTWTPTEWLLAGIRVLASHDQESRTVGIGTTGAAARSGLLRSYEYRAGVAVFPWTGAILDLGVAALDRRDGLADTATLKVAPTLGIEQAILSKSLWLRAGLDETTWTAGASVAASPFKLDVAVLRNLAAERTGDVFGKSNVAAIATLTFHYDAFLRERTLP